MFCRYCGNAINPEERFCLRCGAQLYTDQDYVLNANQDYIFNTDQNYVFNNDQDYVLNTDQSYVFNNVQPVKKSGKKIFSKILISGVAFCVIIGIILSLFIFGSDTDIIKIKDASSILGRFTKVLVKDDISAISVAKEATSLLGLGNAADELTVDNKSTSGNMTYYRMQQNYKGMAVFGRTMVVIANTKGVVQGFSSNAINIPDDLDTSIDLDETDLKQTLGIWLSEDKNNIELLNCEKVIFDNFENPEKSELCYHVTAKTFGKEKGICSAIVSAKDKDVIYNDILLDPAEICLSTTGDRFSGSKDSYGKYMLFDLENHFYCLDANEGNANLPNSADAIKSNTQTFSSKYDFVFKAKNNIDNIANYYKETFADNGTDHFALVVNNGAGTTGGLMPSYVSEDLLNVKGIPEYVGAVSLGSGENEDVADEINLLAHEYTHVISRNKVGWFGGIDFANQAQAINEAYSDLFAMIISEKINPDGYIWDNGIRIADIAKMTSTKYPTKIDSCDTTFGTGSNGGGNGDERDVLWSQDKNGNDIDVYSYTNAMTLQYAAYLMTTEKHGLSIDKLADLWYSTMLTLPSNCTYSQFRRNMENTAQIKGYSKKTQEEISSAFEKIGVDSQDNDNGFSTKFDLSVVLVENKESEICTDYTIDIKGKKKTLSGETDYSKKIYVKEKEPTSIELPKGKYTVTVTAADGGYTVSQEISVTNSKKARKTLVMTIDNTTANSQEESGKNNQKKPEENDQEESKVISREEYVKNQLIGEWRHDADKTYAETGKSMMDIYGTSIKYGSSMIFNEDDSFSYYIGAGNGGKGTFSVETIKKISYQITTYEEGNVEKGTIAIEEEGNQMYLVMTYFDCKVYWSQNSSKNDVEEDSKEDQNDTSSQNENSKDDTNDMSVEKLRKNIIGYWYCPHFERINYVFRENGVCERKHSQETPGTYEITADKTLKINTPWLTKNLKWVSDSDNPGGWCFTADGSLIIDGDPLNRR